MVLMLNKLMHIVSILCVRVCCVSFSFLKPQSRVCAVLAKNVCTVRRSYADYKVQICISYFSQEDEIVALKQLNNLEVFPCTSNSTVKIEYLSLVVSITSCVSSWQHFLCEGPHTSPCLGAFLHTLREQEEGCRDRNMISLLEWEAKQVVFHIYSIILALL